MAVIISASAEGTAMLDPTMIGRSLPAGDRGQRGDRGGLPARREQRARPLLRTMLGDVLRRTRAEQGRTLADVARSAKISMPYLSEIERGRKEASSEILASICDALGLELSDLLAGIQSDLACDQAVPAQIIRLGAIPGHRQLPGRQLPGRQLPGRQLPGAPGPGDVVCLLAA
jgi:transcriptional regulator with XRE-family HTH domain